MFALFAAATAGASMRQRLSVSGLICIFIVVFLAFFFFTGEYEHSSESLSESSTEQLTTYLTILLITFFPRFFLGLRLIGEQEESERLHSEGLCFTMMIFCFFLLREQ
jgi:succinate dehydrogenase hydrophobic anchor subunit